MRHRILVSYPRAGFLPPTVEIDGEPQIHAGGSTIHHFFGSVREPRAAWYGGWSSAMNCAISKSGMTNLVVSLNWLIIRNTKAEPWFRWGCSIYWTSLTLPQKDAHNDTNNVYLIVRDFQINSQRQARISPIDCPNRRNSRLGWTTMWRSGNAFGCPKKNTCCVSPCEAVTIILYSCGSTDRCLIWRMILEDRRFFADLRS